MRKLLVFAYAFNRNSQVFSHQVDVINGFRYSFDEVVVMSPDVNILDVSKSENVFKHSHSVLSVIELKFNKGHSILNSLQLLRSTLKLLRNSKIDSVFYFMVETYAAVLGPIFSIKRVPQVLWYAHANKSKTLMFASIFMKFICSSTRGSMPLKSKKVRLLGQMVDENLFMTDHRVKLREPLNLIHIGRLDPSKRPLDIINASMEISSKYDVKLTFVGAPTTQDGKVQLDKIKIDFTEFINRGQLCFLPAVSRDRILEILRCSDIFVHAFRGSLDKTLVEATMACTPVATINGEYLMEFGQWSARSSSLSDEICAIIEMSDEERFVELLRRREIAVRKHSFSQWSQKMQKILLMENS